MKCLLFFVFMLNPIDSFSYSPSPPPPNVNVKPSNGLGKKNNNDFENSETSSETSKEIKLRPKLKKKNKKKFIEKYNSNINIPDSPSEKIKKLRDNLCRLANFVNETMQEAIDVSQQAINKVGLVQYKINYRFESLRSLIYGHKKRISQAYCILRSPSLHKIANGDRAVTTNQDLTEEIRKCFGYSMQCVSLDSQPEAPVFYDQSHPFQFSFASDSLFLDKNLSSDFDLSSCGYIAKNTAAQNSSKKTINQQQSYQNDKFKTEEEKEIDKNINKMETKINDVQNKLGIITEQIKNDPISLEYDKNYKKVSDSYEKIYTASSIKDKFFPSNSLCNPKFPADLVERVNDKLVNKIKDYKLDIVNILDKSNKFFEKIDLFSLNIRKTIRSSFALKKSSSRLKLRLDKLKKQKNDLDREEQAHKSKYGNKPFSSEAQNNRLRLNNKWLSLSEKSKLLQKDIEDLNSRLDSLNDDVESTIREGKSAKQNVKNIVQESIDSLKQLPETLDQMQDTVDYLLKVFDSNMSTLEKWSCDAPSCVKETLLYLTRNKLDLIDYYNTFTYEWSQSIEPMLVQNAEEAKVPSQETRQNISLDVDIPLLGKTKSIDIFSSFCPNTPPTISGLLGFLNIKGGDLQILDFSENYENFELSLYSFFEDKIFKLDNKNSFLEIKGKKLNDILKIRIPILVQFIINHEILGIETKPIKFSLGIIIEGKIPYSVELLTENYNSNYLVSAVKSQSLLQFIIKTDQKNRDDYKFTIAPIRSHIEAVEPLPTKKLYTLLAILENIIQKDINKKDNNSVLNTCWQKMTDFKLVFDVDGLSVKPVGIYHPNHLEKVRECKNIFMKNFEGYTKSWINVINEKDFISLLEKINKSLDY